MDSNINLILPSIQSFCRQGFLLPLQKQALYSMAEAHGIARDELEKYITVELKNARKATLEALYKASKQPDAAICDEVKLYTQSRRQFPDVVQLGSLTLKMNKNVHAPAFVPIQGMNGLCVKYSASHENARNILLNATIRIILSIRRSLAKITLVDPVNMGADFLQLSGLDRRLLTVLKEDNEVVSYFQKLVKDLSDFNFNEMGNRYEDLSSYNRDHISNARPYELIIVPDLPTCLNKNCLPLLERIIKLSNKLGVFFMFTVKVSDLKTNPTLLDVFQNNLCIVDLNNNVPAIETTEVTKLFNNAYDFSPRTELEFDNNTINEINHEFDPASWNIAKTDNSGLYSVESVVITLGNKTTNGKNVSVQLERQGDNMLVLSSDASLVDKNIQNIIGGIVNNYKHNEISYMFYNCPSINASVNGDDVNLNIHTDKWHYLQGMLRHLAEIIENRKQLFNGLDYTAYRNSNEGNMPRIICVINEIDKALDTDDISAVESIMILDTLLGVAGQYGVHFILAGSPTFSFFKINISEYVNYMLLSALSELETSQIGLFLNEEDIIQIRTKDQNFLYSPKLGQNVVLESPSNDENWKKALEKLSISNGSISVPTNLEDFGDTYPPSYSEIKIPQISDSALEGVIPIGVIRGLSNSYAGLKQTGVNTFIVGNDTESSESILKSVYETQKRKGFSDGFYVYDAANTYLIGISGLPGVNPHSQLSTITAKPNGVICLLNMDEYDFYSSTEFDRLMDQAAQVNSKIIIFSKTDLLSEGKLGIFQNRFSEKIAIAGVPESFATPLLLASSTPISVPQCPYCALLETSLTNYSTDINGLWLYK